MQDIKIEQRKTIALVANSTWNIYNFRLNVIDKLLEEGHKVIVFAPIDEYLKYKENYPTIKHIGIKRLGRYGINPLKDFLLILELLKKYKKFKPDVILHYTSKPNLYGGIASRLARIPSIANITGLGYAFIHKDGLINKITRLLYKLTGKLHKKVIFQNPIDQELFIKSGFIEESKSILIKGSGVDTSYFLPSENGIDYQRPTFTFIGRLLYDKGIREFVNAARHIKIHHPHVRFWVVGQLDANNPASVEKDELNTWIDQKIIDYRGFNLDVRPVLKQTDCVVLPSYREGLPRIIIEGLAMGKPVITTDTAGCKETVEEGENGFLIQIKSSKELIFAIEKFLKLNHKEQKIMGMNGRKKAENEFDSNLIANQIYEVVKSII